LVNAWGEGGGTLIERQKTEKVETREGKGEKKTAVGTNVKKRGRLTGDPA